MSNHWWGNTTANTTFTSDPQASGAGFLFAQTPNASQAYAPSDTFTSETSNAAFFSVTQTKTPEPGTGTLLGAGLLIGIALGRRRGTTV